MLRATGGWGYHNDTEILFPMRIAPQLRDLRDEPWHELVAQAIQAEEDSPEQLAFSLLLIRLNGCLSCHTDCYRAMRGCTICAITAVRRYRGADEELIQMYETALDEVSAYMQDGLVLRTMGDG